MKGVERDGLRVWCPGNQEFDDNQHHGDGDVSLHLLFLGSSLHLLRLVDVELADIFYLQVENNRS